MLAPRRPQVNKFVEHVSTIMDSVGVGRLDAHEKEKLKGRSRDASAIIKVMQLWRKGVLLIDEVDMLLHPLRSELNFPLGQKQKLDLHGLRWELPMHLLDTLLGAVDAETANVEAPDPQSPLAALRAALRTGVDEKQLLLSTPHLVLLSPAWYDEHVKPLLAPFAVSYMKQCHVFEGTELDDVQILEYLTRGVASSEQTCCAVRELGEAGERGPCVQAMNLAQDWLQSFLPHVISKVNRVSYGLLQETDLLALEGAKADGGGAESGGKSQPASRLLLAVPFDGKDKPSQAAEFAQPDTAVSAAAPLKPMRKQELGAPLPPPRACLLACASTCAAVLCI